MKNTDFSPYLSISPAELRKLQWKKGWPLSFVGAIVYGILRLFLRKPMDYKGICPYFIIGNNWGGVCFGWFFICCKNCGDYTKQHEVGHLIQNAAVGGVVMLFYSICSAARYTFRLLFGSDKPYDSWFFEGDATRLGEEYLKHIKEIKE